MIDSCTRPLGVAALCAALAACSGLNARTVTHKTPAPATSKSVPAGGEFADLARWPHVGQFIERMAQHDGFEPVELQRLLGKVQRLDAVIQLIKPAPPSRPKDWRAYRARFVEPVRINAGVRFWNEYSDKLAQAEAQYGVPAEIIVAILGVETVYGRHTGNFRVLDAIATLAFDYPDTPNRVTRMAYFQGELENTLLFARQAGIDPFSLLGSYAGAVGWPQFMPGSILRYAIDFDGDGRIDLRNSPADAIGSIANFLVRHGWQAGAPIVFPASVATDGSRDWESFIGQGLKASYSPEQLRAGGVTPGIEPLPEMRYGLVDLQNGDQPTEYWLGADNFFVITQYNRSYFYAMSVIDLSRAIRAIRNH